MPKPEKKGWGWEAGKSKFGGARGSLYDQMDAYEYDDDMEGYGSKPFSKKKKGKGKKVQEEEEDQVPEHFEIPEEEGQEGQTESGAQEAQEGQEAPKVPSIQISFGPSQAAPEPEANSQEDFFAEDQFRNDTIVLETYDNWEDAVDALDTAMSKLEEEKANQKVNPVPSKKS
jgi:hypothetical protein